jgi:L-ascorbate metabolism protein UlaG (beta-lactamase superfamily)
MKFLGIGLLWFSFGTLAHAAAPVTPAKIKTEVTWMGHAAWIVKTPGGAVLAIDPWFDNPKAPKDVPAPTALDAILISHGHADHVGDAAALATKTGAAVVGSYELVGLLGATNGMGGNAGGTVRIKDATIHMVEAVHSSSFTPKAEAAATDKTKAAPPQYAGAPVGFVIVIDNGPTF